MADKVSDDWAAYHEQAIRAEHTDWKDAQVAKAMDDWYAQQAAQSGGYGTKYSPDYEMRSVTEPRDSWSSGSQQSQSRSVTDGTQNSTTTNIIPGVRINPDGTQNVDDLNALKNKQAEQIRAAFLADAIGANRDKIRGQREKEMEENNRRAKIAAWTDSARLISDMIFGAAGGNVYQRDPNNIAKEARERNAQLRELQAAEDAQNALQDYQRNKDMALAILQNNQRIDQAATIQQHSGTNHSVSNGSSSGTSSNHTRDNGTRSTSGYVAVDDGGDFASIYGPDGSFGTANKKASNSGLRFDFEQFDGKDGLRSRLSPGYGNQTLGGYTNNGYGGRTSGLLDGSFRLQVGNGGRKASNTDFPHF